MFGYPYREETAGEAWLRRGALAARLFLSVCVGVAGTLVVHRPGPRRVVLALRAPEPPRADITAASAGMRAAVLLGSLPRQPRADQVTSLALVAPELRAAFRARYGRCPAVLAGTPGCDRSRGFAALSPIEARVDRETKSAAEVTVWLVAVTAADEAEPAQAAWMTLRLSLVWRGGSGWLVTSMVSAPGPVPAEVAPPSPAGELAAPGDRADRTGFSVPRL
jgi:hypothetical protein